MCSSHQMPAVNVTYACPKMQASNHAMQATIFELLVLSLQKGCGQWGVKKIHKIKPPPLLCGKSQIFWAFLLEEKKGFCGPNHMGLAEAEWDGLSCHS